MNDDPKPALPAGPARVPSLDGLRALAVLLVIAGHARGTRWWDGQASVPGVHGLGNLGVRVFFVISGFLITSLLVEELRRTGRIAVLRFTARRALRIFPALYAYVGVLVVLDAAHAVLLAPGDLTAAATYTMNHHRPRGFPVAHLWSLAVEEQFYLLWPGALALLGARWGPRAAAAMLVVAPIVRLILWNQGGAARLDVGESFLTVADALATGAVLAAWRPRLDASLGYQRWLASPAFVLVPAAVATIFALDDRPWLWLGGGETVMNVGIALIVDRAVRRPHDAFGRLLNSRAAVALGTLSYSLYLWQQLFLNRYESAWPQRFPLNVALALAAAIASYAALERPFLKLRARLRVIKSPIP